MNLSTLNVQELSTNELREIEGGIAPLILAAWGVMAVCSAISLGMKEALDEHNAKK